MRMTDTNMAWMPSWLASDIRITRKMPKRRLFTFVSFRSNAARSDWCGEDSLGRPAFAMPIVHGMWSHPKFPSPLNGGEGFPVVGDLNVYSGVVKLFFLCGPSAIARLVITVIVNAVKGVIRAWPFSNISEKVFKLVPTLANDNPSCPIVWIRGSCRLVASNHHSAPYGINVGPGPTMRSVVDGGVSSNHLAMKTPARYGLSIPQGLTRDRLFCSAIADTYPFLVLPRNRRDAAQNKNAPKSLPSQVYDMAAWHTENNNIDVCINARMAS